MTRLNLMLTAGAVALGAVSVALAQQNADPAPAVQPAAPSAGAAGANANATMGAAAPDVPGQVQAITQADNTLVTNGPVPDTPANRAKFGGPMSMTGKKTKPAGN